MRSLAISFLLATLALSSCRRAEGVATVNSADPAANRIEDVSGAGPKPLHPCVNLNTATGEELRRLPGVGEVMSRRIIEYRELHGPFRRAEEIIIIEGFSERKYRAISDLVCAD